MVRMKKKGQTKKRETKVINVDVSVKLRNFADF